MSLREELGQLVRQVWVEWANHQPNPKPSWLTPWSELSEPDREVDRLIGVALWRKGMTDAAKVAEDLADKYSMNVRDNSYKWPCERVADNIELQRDNQTNENREQNIH